MSANDPHPDSPPGDAPDANPDSPPPAERDDPRPDIQQVVEARADAVARGEGGEEPARFTDPGTFDGNSGTGGEVRNQDLTQQ